MSAESTPELTASVCAAAALIRECRHLCVSTGAGVSAESGVPTFRGADGLWEGQRVEDVATPEAFARQPHEVWQFYLARRQRLAHIKPNPGHFALAELERRVPTFDLITQNVDGLHRAAGSRRVIELHGDVCIDRCTACRHERRTPDLNAAEAPRCPRCTAPMRPGVVWFGEVLPAEALQAAARAAESCDVLLVAGTSGVVEPAASLVGLARSHGARVLEINMERTPLTPLTYRHLAGPSGVVLPAIVKKMMEQGAEP